jgi:uncharacterized protein (TIGR02145 family)
MRSGNDNSSTKLLAGNLWMTTNLAVNIPGSYCYGDSDENCEKYGRLYTWESAKKGCNTLGKDWHLPSVAEWQQITLLYKGAAQDTSTTRKQAYRELLIGGSSGFDALLGGGRELEGKYARMEAHGFYWTATEIDSSTAWNFNFAKGSQSLYQQDGGDKKEAYSVRCVKNNSASDQGKAQ